jgi:outer membrane protein TolC
MTAVVAPDEVQVALTNEGLLAERLQGQEKALSDYTEAVRIGTVKYVAGAMDMLSLLQLEERQIESQAAVIQLRDALLANRITPHLPRGVVSTRRRPRRPLAR